MSVFRRLISSSHLLYPSLSLHFPPPSMTPPFPSLYSAVIKVVIKNFDVAKKRSHNANARARPEVAMMKKDEDGRIKNLRSKNDAGVQGQLQHETTSLLQHATHRRTRPSLLLTSKTPNTPIRTNAAQLQAVTSPSTTAVSVGGPPGGASTPIATLILSLSRHAKHTPPPYTLVCLRHPSPVTISPTTSTPAAVML
ncbi:hypothetical protein VC83_08703 [Pseudogymnoascus destructans]|uniref:Uncharacterized protein n=1 Tax=Pseudogymnoascus destructans TaxID=655981 RepID=A0A176ZYW6_9PEZI|nr:uncharacterized protein VC83_08703 [Pseudogymnoascus destructans]OAF55078.1 hypothetical protein VC83_08703 [Pseudogymnoascus destructans]